MSIDPVTTDANTGSSFNRYSYANNSPYKYIDPDGRDSALWCWGSQELSSRSNTTIAPTPALSQGWHGQQAASLNDALQLGAPGGTGLKASVGAVGMIGTFFKGESKIAIGELKLLHSAETIGKRPDLAKLSDADLLKSVTNPKNGDMLKISTQSGKVVDGNSRGAELMKRAADPASKITPDTKIPFKAHKPDNSMF